MIELWFKAKSYGWGWQPVTKEGWLLTIAVGLYIGLSSWGFGFLLDNLQGYRASVYYVCLALYISSLLFMSFLFILILMSRGEKPRWSWGKRERK